MIYLMYAHATLKTVYHLIDAYAPSLNPVLWANRALHPITGKEQDIVKKIDSLKETVCKIHGIPPQNVRLQKEGGISVMQVHGSKHDAIIGIATSVFQDIQNSHKQPPTFLSTFPDHWEGMKKAVQRYPRNEVLSKYDILRSHMQQLSERKLEFSLHHEIGGHLKHDDERTKRTFAAFLRWLGIFGMGSVVTKLQLPWAGIFLQVGFYLLAEKGIESILSRGREQRADQEAVAQGFQSECQQLLKMICLIDVFSEHLGFTKTPSLLEKVFPTDDERKQRLQNVFSKKVY